ncbi:hypothetical protein M0R72_12555 [Candidatus Pacearchaeota archaeon]|jgi:hypothetical protein|nr:hypothetical protein [Candidatus Pacearchaeota archaeon]
MSERPYLPLQQVGKTIVARDGTLVATMAPNQKNWAEKQDLLVSAVNAHDALVAALNETRAAWRATGQPIGEAWEHGSVALALAEPTPCP